VSRAQLLHPRQRLVELRRHGLVLVLLRRLNVRPAERARRVRGQPHIDALHVVQVLAQGKPPHLLAGMHRADTDRALRLAAAAVPSRRLGVRERLRQRSNVHADRGPLLWAALCTGGGGDPCTAFAGTVLAEYYEDGDDGSAGEANEGAAEYQCPFGRRVLGGTKVVAPEAMVVPWWEVERTAPLVSALRSSSFLLDIKTTAAFLGGKKAE
jgi:hypothetical protein